MDECHKQAYRVGDVSGVGNEIQRNRDHRRDKQRPHGIGAGGRAFGGERVAPVGSHRLTLRFLRPGLLSARTTIARARGLRICYTRKRPKMILSATILLWEAARK